MFRKFIVNNQGSGKVEFAMYLVIMAVVAVILVPQINPMLHNFKKTIDIYNAKELAKTTTYVTTINEECVGFVGTINLGDDEADAFETYILEQYKIAPKLLTYIEKDFVVHIEEDSGIIVTDTDGVMIYPNPEEPYQKTTRK